VPLPSQALHGITPVPSQASQLARPPPDCHSPPLPPHRLQAVVPSPPHSGHTIPPACRQSADPRDDDIHPVRPDRYLTRIVPLQIPGLPRSCNPALTQTDAYVNITLKARSRHHHVPGP
jgi:hypothetical protein